MWLALDGDAAHVSAGEHRVDRVARVQLGAHRGLDRIHENLRRGEGDERGNDTASGDGEFDLIHADADGAGKRDLHLKARGVIERRHVARQAHGAGGLEGGGGAIDKVFSDGYVGRRRRLLQARRARR
eukprot:3606516-Prymnesium_polylepis.1